GCASWVSPVSNKQVGSVVNYLYPNATTAPELQPGITTLRPPVRVGLAFVPGETGVASLSENDKQQLLEKVKAAFSQHAYIGAIEIIPGNYLQAKGGFANLEQVARMFNVEVVALLSYDQVQFNDNNALALLYWTLVGAYVINGDQYDIHTLVDASIFDVRSRKLLFRAPGSSRIKGSASMAGFNEKSRLARSAGFSQAVDQLIPQLQRQLDLFRERLKAEADKPGTPGASGIKVDNKPGYSGSGALDGLELALLGLLAGCGWLARRRG
ncbi:MAG: rhombotarget lipoprotein, partial [Pseudomonadota bacterium]